MPSKPDQNRKDVAAHRERERQAGFVRVEVKVPAEDTDVIRALATQLCRRKMSLTESKP